MVSLLLSLDLGRGHLSKGTLAGGALGIALGSAQGNAQIREGSKKVEKRLREGKLRACANRSWPAERSAIPSVAGPGFADEPPDDDDYARESHPELDHASSSFRAPH